MVGLRISNRDVIMKLHWAIQKNIMRPDRFFAVINACKQLQYPFVTFRAYPDYPSKLHIHGFPDLPDIPSDIPVIFCATTFVVRRVYEAKKWFPGVYFDPDNFTTTAYKENYNDAFLNADCQVTTLGEFMNAGYDNDETFFIRPVKDLKEFTGLVVKYQDIAEWDFETDSRDYATPKTEIIVSKPQDISKEWRLVVIDEKVCSGTQYVEDGHLKEDPTLPEKVVSFTEELAKTWSPARVFALDICELKSGEIKLLECNCFNCSGLYAADIHKIVKEVSELT